ncbi:unnamed protein product [Staurois parvus]|uniref:Secreted protein n=1 Tax=Staurois parvus TaxID=386267 RepID=A0ABN9HN46_9NEOB|nr:unnamed protein product [Staurois parvus]
MCRAQRCHAVLHLLLTLRHSAMGPCTASSCCCQARNLPWAPVPTSSCCCQGPVICHGPLYRPPHAAARSRVCHGSLYGLPLLLSPSPTLCHVPLSGLLTLLVGSILS